MRELTIPEAEALAGERLDRRRKYATTDDGQPWSVSGKLVFALARWTQACSGCNCDCGDGYPCSHGASGCEECGYTGRSRIVM